MSIETTLFMIHFTKEPFQSNTGFSGMRAARNTVILFLLSFLVLPVPVFSQTYDLLLKGGHVIDPHNHIDTPMDVAVHDGVVAHIAEEIPESRATTVVDVSGLYVVPGLVDIHAHLFHGTEQDAYLSNSFAAVPPDHFSFKYGVTTMVDVGGPGWRNYRTFKEQTIDNSATRVLAFLNIVGAGMKGGHIEQNLNDMDPKMTALVIQNNDWLVGVKVAHYMGHEWEPIHRVVEAGERANVPVMVDFGGADPPLSLETLFLEKLRPGDIFTHTYANLESREAIVDGEYHLKPFVLEAKEKGILFDVGHGGASFNFKTAIPAVRQGLPPDLISTDLHKGSSNAGMKNMLNVMSKFLNMGMTLYDVIDRSTSRPAASINRTDFGHLGEGAEADIAVLRLREGEFGFVDARPGHRMDGSQLLECELTLRAGSVVWDRNGLTASSWDESR